MAKYIFATPDGEGVVEIAGTLTNAQLNKLHEAGFRHISPKEAKVIIRKMRAEEKRHAEDER